MSTTPHGTVKETGAKANSLLLGINKLNMDMVIQVLEDQKLSDKSPGGQVKGAFVLVRAGAGTYSDQLKPYEGKYLDAKELIDLVRNSGGIAEVATHFLNRNQLKLLESEVSGLSTTDLLEKFKEKERISKVPDILRASSARNSISEASLESLLMNNLELLERGLKLVQQQFDCREAGRLDLLCEDTNGDLVIVELKKAGANHDSVVGQILRYIGYVQTHVAREGQKVRGLIVVGKIDEKLKYAVSVIPNVEVKTFDLTIR